MLRRVLPVAGAAALILVPSSAWAAPASGPVSHFAYAGYFAQVDTRLPDGRTVYATLSQYYGANHSESDGFLYLSVGPPCDVASTGQQCLPGASAFAELTGDQVEFDRGLTGASVEDVPLTLTTPAHYVWNSGSTEAVFVPATTEDVTVSLAFTGTGTIDRSAQHILADYCGADSTGCQSTGIGARRTADVTVTLAWASGEPNALDSDAGLLTYDQSVDNVMPEDAH